MGDGLVDARIKGSLQEVGLSDTASTLLPIVPLQAQPQPGVTRIHVSMHQGRRFMNDTFKTGALGEISFLSQELSTNNLLVIDFHRVS